MSIPSLLLAAILLGAPSQQGDAPVEVSLRVDVSALPDESLTSEIADTLRQRQTQLLVDGGASVVDDASSTIVVTVSRYGDGDVHYRFTVALLQAGSAEPVVERTGTCELCRESELFAKVGDEVARVSGRLLFAPPEPEREPEPGPEVGPPQGPPEGDVTQETEPAPRVRRVGGAGWAGIGVAVAGVAATVAGAVMLATPSERKATTGDNRSLDLIEYPRPAGGATLGVGIGAVVVGSVLLIVDQTVLLDRRRRARPTSLAPAHMRSGLGVTWTLRF